MNDPLEYTEPGENADPEDYYLHRYVTTKVAHSDPLHMPLWVWLRKRVGPTRLDTILLTTEECWSGWSDQTISNEWTSIVVTVPDAHFEHRWDTLPEFLRDMLEVAQ